jgi:hypothetical protein
MAIKIDEKNLRVVAKSEGERKLNDLRAQRGVKERELSEATSRYMAVRMEQRSTIEIEAAALISGESVKAGVTAEDLEKIEREIQVFDAAIRQQTKLVDKLSGEFTVAISEANRQQYVAIEKRIAAAVAELAEANEAEVIFFRELQDAGCTSIPFRPMRMTSVGIMSDMQSSAAFHRKEVAQYCPEALA